MTPTRKSEVLKDWVSWNLPRILPDRLPVASAQDRRCRQLLKGTTFSVAAAPPPSREAVLVAQGTAASHAALSTESFQHSGRRRQKMPLRSELGDSILRPSEQGIRGGRQFPAAAPALSREAASAAPCRAGARMFSGLSVTFSSFRSPSAAPFCPTRFSASLYTCGARPGGRLDAGRDFPAAVT